MIRLARAVIDTSVLIADESGRRVDIDSLPEQGLLTVITLAELHTGVLTAADTPTRARRLATLDAAAFVEPLPVDAAAAREWARV